MAYDFDRPSEAVQALQAKLANLNLQITRMNAPATYTEVEHTETTGILFWRTSTHGVIRRYYQTGRADAFFSDAELEKERKAHESALTDLCAQEAETAKALRVQIEHEEAVAAAEARGLAAGKKMGVRAAATVSPRLRRNALLVASSSEATIAFADFAIQAAQTAKDEAKSDLADAQIVIDGLR